MLSKMRKRNEGFTLIELMIVIAIIGILAAIAIPQFAAYRTRSWNASANADLRNACTAQEAYFVDEGTYASAVASLTGGYGLVISTGNTITIGTANGTEYVMRGRNDKGSNTYYIAGPGGSVTIE